MSVVVPSLLLAGGAATALAAAPEDQDAGCRIPFETLKDSKTGAVFPLSAALNDNDKLPDHLRRRYIVADLSTTDETGTCRGVQEHFTPVGELSELPRLKAIAAARGVDIAALASESVGTLLASEATAGDPAGLAIELEDLQNYLKQVEPYKTEPLLRPGVFKGHCTGQTLNLCEIVNGQPKLVYRFVTSSSKWLLPLYRYYAPINIVRSRSWSSDRRYTAADARRDARMGGGSAGIVPFANGGNPIEMPNFLHFVPMTGYMGETANGIHQIAGGLDSGGWFGAPVSLGCLRLGRFQSKLARWWTPTQAKFFIHFEPNRYRTYGIAKTGKALGFRAPLPEQVPVQAKAQAKTETIAVAERPAAPPEPPPASTRTKRKRATSSSADSPVGFFSFAPN